MKSVLASVLMSSWAAVCCGRRQLHAKLGPAV
jgi:hypothetical protein